jgi:hypothetical protein
MSDPQSRPSEPRRLFALVGPSESLRKTVLKGAVAVAGVLSLVWYVAGVSGIISVGALTVRVAMHWRPFVTDHANAVDAGDDQPITLSIGRVRNERQQ